jgi:hypothetical protein
MMNQKHYIVKYMTQEGDQFILHKSGRKFLHNNYAGTKEYKTLASARKKAKSIRANPMFYNDRGDIIVVEVTFEPCNPQLVDGFYRPVETVVSSL